MAEETVSLEQLCRATIARDGDRPFIEFDGRWFPQRTVNALARKIIACIDAAGLGENPLVVLAARNRPATLAAFLALLARGCTVRMVYPFQSAEALAAELQTIQPALALITEEDIASPVTRALRNCGSALLSLSIADAQLANGLERSANGNHGAGVAQLILLTSGTTGYPKPFSLDFATVARYYAGDMRWRSTPSAEAVDTETLDTTPAFLYFPIGNISGLYTTLPALLSGQPVVLRDRFSLDAWLDFVQRFQPVVFGMPPAAFQEFLDLNIDPAAISSIRAMGAGAAPLDVNVKQAFEARYGIPILLSYGATEFGGPVTRMTLQMHLEIGDSKRGTVGQPMEGMSIRIVNADTGLPVPAGVEGVVEVISCRIGPDWIHTSDIGVMDEDGYLYLRGRTDGAIIRGGFKLVPEIIETALIQHPSVASAAVVAVADRRLGQVPGAVVVLKSGGSHSSKDLLEDLEAELRKRLPATHIPVHWRIVDALPKTPSVKVDVAALRGMFSYGHD
jgi:acyl-coenzyme A synthetase/AMP-(fatty) acid ligase